jgi:hypothetical protein
MAKGTSVSSIYAELDESMPQRDAISGLELLTDKRPLPARFVSDFPGVSVFFKEKQIKMNYSPLHSNV